MNWQTYCLVVLALLSACTHAVRVDAESTQLPRTRAAHHSVTRKLSPPEFRAALREVADPYYPNYLDGFAAEQCKEFPAVIGLGECAEMVLEDEVPVFVQRFCLHMSIKALVAGEICRQPTDYVINAAQLAVKYATMISETADPVLRQRNARAQLYTAALIARQYLSADHARVAALRVYVVLCEHYQHQHCSGVDAARLGKLASQIHDFERQFLVLEDIRSFQSDAALFCVRH